MKIKNYTVFILFFIGFVVDALAQVPPPPPPGLPIDLGVGFLAIVAIGLGVKKIKK